MGAQLRVYRRRIRSVTATKKITRAMELIASSRIVKAQQRVEATLPYTNTLVQALSAAASHTRSDHPLLAAAKDHKRAGVIILTADRGLAGGYSINTLKEADRLAALLRDERDMQVVHWLMGRKAIGYFKFRGRPIEAEYTGFTESPSFSDAKMIAEAVLERFLQPTDEGGLDEIFLVYTHYVNRVRQEPRVIRILPLEVEEAPSDAATAVNSPDAGTVAAKSGQLLPMFDFEPSAEAVLDSLLPKYVVSLIYTSLLLAAASEHAARQRAMSSATDNAGELIKTLTRQANQARQAEITQEISEIVGGADALASANSGS